MGDYIMGIKKLFIKRNEKADFEPFKLPPREFPRPINRPSDDFKLPDLDIQKPRELPEIEPLMQPKRMIEPLKLKNTISDVRMPEPHLFIKVDKYQEVRENSKKLGERLKELNDALIKMEEIKLEENRKISNIKETVEGMHKIALKLDKTFKEAREEYE